MQQPHGPGQEVIRVFLADNTRIHAQLLADALMRDPSLKVVGSACRAQEIIDAAPTSRPDVLVISSSLDEESLLGLDVLRKVCILVPRIRAVVLMDSSKEEAVLEAFRAGARGVFGRHESLETLCKCVRQVHGGQVWANSEQISFAVAALASTPTVRAIDAKGLNLLSKRELDVVRSLAEGLTNREIAERLGLSQHTIKNYLFRVFDKLGVSSRMELLFLTLNQPMSQTSEGNRALEWNGRNGDASFVNCQSAAEGGILEAQIALGQMYSEGKGIQRDDISAYMWYLISEQRTLEMKEIVSSSKRKLAEVLSTEQILEAQKNASERLRRSVRPASSIRPPVQPAGKMAVKL
jgi:two-component system nitrate/nitrite response regulator NarL